MSTISSACKKGALTMTSLYVFWAIVGMVAYSFTTVVVKIATRAGLPSSVVVTIATTVVALTCWSIVIARGQSGTLLQSLSSPAGAWSLGAGVALSVAVTSLFRTLELGPASVVVPIYGMFVVGGFVLGVVLLGEAITFPKAVGLVAAIASIYLIST
jgi:transporter family protein